MRNNKSKRIELLRVATARFQKDNESQHLDIKFSHQKHEQIYNKLSDGSCQMYKVTSTVIFYNEGTKYTSIISPWYVFQRKCL